MSVDLEDYFCDLPFSTWDKFQSRMVETTDVLLNLFKKYKVTATFFTLGYIAERHPELVERIVTEGHEIASHSFKHTDIRTMDETSFENDLIKSIKTLEKISGENILGFRAPFFSITKKNLWAFKIIKKHLKYDSSIFPVKTPLYGIPDAPRYPYHMIAEEPLVKTENGELFEIPLATLRIPPFGNIPIAGGFHLRFLPFWLIKMGIKKFNKAGKSAMLYIHPKDLDPKMPKISQYSWHYYYGLQNAEKKFESLLKHFTFSSTREIYFKN